MDVGDVVNFLTDWLFCNYLTLYLAYCDTQNDTDASVEEDL